MDYRRTKYCPELVDIKEKKKKIEALIKRNIRMHKICILI